MESSATLKDNREPHQRAVFTYDKSRAAPCWTRLGIRGFARPNGGRAHAHGYGMKSTGTGLLTAVQKPLAGSITTKA